MPRDRTTRNVWILAASCAVSIGVAVWSVTMDDYLWALVAIASAVLNGAAAVVLHSQRG